MRIEDLLARQHRHASRNGDAPTAWLKDLLASGYAPVQCGDARFMVKQQGDDLTIYIKEGRKYRFMDEYVRKRA